MTLEEYPRSASARSPSRAAPSSESRVDRLVADGLALTYLAAIGWLALRGMRWLIAG